jgi:hypothetical protein
MSKEYLILKELREFRTFVDQKFRDIDKRFNNLVARFNNTDNRQNSFDAKLDKILEQVTLNSQKLNFLYEGNLFVTKYQLEELIKVNNLAPIPQP